MSSGNSSGVDATMVVESAAVTNGMHDTPVRRRLGTSTDDAAIFFEDTVDRMTAQCIEASPSALALLTPQRMPTGHNTHVDVTEYDASHLGSLSSTRRKSSGENSYNSNDSNSNSGSKGRSSGQRATLHDVTNTSSVKLNFATGTNSKSPTPKQARRSSSHLSHSHRHRVGSHSSLKTRGGSLHSAHDRSPSAAEPTVSLADYEALQKERNRFEKMYEHQRALYEEMAEKQAETYQSLQEKIIEVVALSTRNEESKRFIRQLKREFSESRTRVMDMQNKALEEAKAERNTRSHYEALIQEQERKYDRLVERQETKLAGMESLVKDLTCLRGDEDQLHVSQLDMLLKASYSKSTALFSDLLRQSRQIDLLYETKTDLENQVEQLRHEKREMESAMREERRRMMSETERHIEQIEEQQQSILNLRQMLIRTMDNRDNVFAYSRGPRRAQRHDEGDGEINEDDASQSSSSFSSSPSSIKEELEDDRSFDEEESIEGNDDGGRLHREAPRGGPFSTQKQTEKDRGERDDESGNEVRTNPLQLISVAPPVSRGGQSRPVISAAVDASLSSSKGEKAAVVVVPPLPLSSRSNGGGVGGKCCAAASYFASATSSSSSSPAILHQEQPYRNQRHYEGSAAHLAHHEKESNSRDDGVRIANDENSYGKAKHHTVTAPLCATRSPSYASLASHTREEQGDEEAAAAAERNNDNRSNRDGGLLQKKECHSPSSSSSFSTGAAVVVGSRRRIDFTTALAAVTEKRRRDRIAREEGTMDKKTNNDAADGHGKERSGAAVVSRVSSTKADPGKENRDAAGATAGGRRAIVRSGVVGSTATARPLLGAGREENEEEEEPRLFSTR